MDTRFSIDESRVVYEVLEGEVVVVNLDTGNYFILDDTAATIWRLLVDGASPAEVVRTLCFQHPGDGETIRETVLRFVGQLTEEELLTASENAGLRSNVADTPSPADPGASFVPPVLHRYTDMATLIQMDPIHDFDETGWPRRPTPRDR